MPVTLVFRSRHTSLHHDERAESVATLRRRGAATPLPAPPQGAAVAVAVAVAVTVTVAITVAVTVAVVSCYLGSRAEVAGSKQTR